MEGGGREQLKAPAGGPSKQPKGNKQKAKQGKQPERKDAEPEGVPGETTFLSTDSYFEEDDHLDLAT